MKELIQKLDFFSGLDEKIVKKVAEAAIMRQYAREEIIVRQGETGLGMYVILRGRVKVEREQGTKRIQVAELGPEQTFAEMAIIDNKPRSATVTAAEDTECVLLTRDSFVKLMQKHPEIPVAIARVLAERLRVANEKLATGPLPTTPPPPGPEAAAPAPVTAANPAGNGAAPAATAAASWTKARVQDALLGAFQSLYTLKAVTRFSVAMLGCPVEGSAPNLIEEIRVGDVKVLLLPAGERVELKIAAREAGSFNLSVFVPEQGEPIRFESVAINPADRVRLVLEPRRVELCRGERVVAPVAA